jgi:hypothetical protein
MNQSLACKRLLAAVVVMAIKDACFGPKSKIISSHTASAFNFLFEYSDYYLSMLDIDPKQFRVRLLEYVDSKKLDKPLPYSLTDHERRAFSFNYRRWKYVSRFETFDAEETELL